MRQISKLCLLSCLALGGWHNVLAAVACAHFECQSAAATPSSRPSHDAHSSHDDAREASHCGARAQSPAHAHEGAAARVRADAPDAASPSFADAASPGFAPAREDCLHCAGRPAPARATAAERRADEPRRVSHLAPHASHAVGPARPEWSSAARPAPTQHPPPRTVAQQLLFGVFLI